MDLLDGTFEETVLSPPFIFIFFGGMWHGCVKSDILEPYQKCLSNNGGSVCLHSCFIQILFFLFFWMLKFCMHVKSLLSHYDKQTQM